MTALNDSSNQPSLLEHPAWYLLVSTGLFILSVYVSRLARGSTLRRLPLPPGPKGLPVLGNALQIFFSSRKPWFVYREWMEQYAPNGDMLYLNILGKPMLVLGSLKATTELLERRGSTYSDRSVPPSMELIRVPWSLGIMSYGPLWRAHRRMFHQYYNKTQIHKYSSVLEQQTRSYLQKLLSSPKDFMADTRFLFGAIIIQISYGFSTPAEIKTLSGAAEAIVGTFADCAKPGYFLVDMLPFLRWVPSWAPGAGWKRRLQEVGKISDDVFQRPFDGALEKAKQAKGREDAQDVAAKIISKLPPSDDPSYKQQEQLGRGTSLVAYLAGADTTVSAAHALFIALANHPECQRAAQDELDAVIGNDRLPSVADLPRLVYTQAIVKELSRWFNVAPLVLPHISSQDDSYGGFFIPKGTIVTANTWAIMHDPEVFDDPLEFKPERYLTRDQDTQQLKINPAILNPDSAVFGYGRRICPGRHLSAESLTLMTASLMAVFDIKAPKDANGQPIKVEIKTGPEIIQTPLPFEVNIVPRSERHAGLIYRDEC